MRVRWNSIVFSHPPSTSDVVISQAKQHVYECSNSSSLFLSLCNLYVSTTIFVQAGFLVTKTFAVISALIFAVAKSVWLLLLKGLEFVLPSSGFLWPSLVFFFLSVGVVELGFQKLPPCVGRDQLLQKSCLSRADPPAKIFKRESWAFILKSLHSFLHSPLWSHLCAGPCISTL